MLRVGAFIFPLLLAPAGFLPAASRTTVTKTIPASTGPWIVTLSINLDFPFAGSPSPPVQFSASDGLAFQPGDVLTILYDSGMWCSSTYVSAGTCVDANGYRNHPPLNALPLGTSTVYAPSKYMDPSSYPIYSMQLVGTFADARGQIVGVPFKVGNGPVNVTIPVGAAQLQLGANMHDYSSARNYSPPLKASVTGTTLKSMGSMPQLAAGGAWKTTIVLQNSSARPADARLNFFDDAGKPLPLSLSLAHSSSALQPASPSFDTTLPAGAAVSVVCAGAPTAATQTGWAQLVSDGSINAFAIFGMKTGNADHEAVVPLETRSAGSSILWFDNSAGMVTGVALANPLSSPVAIEATVRDESGAVIGTSSIPLPPQGHASFELPARLPQTAQRRGTVEFRPEAGGQISVLGLRFNQQAFTTIPVMAK